MQLVLTKKCQVLELIPVASTFGGLGDHWQQHVQLFLRKWLMTQVLNVI